MKPVALITGITGQDGSYLSEFLLSKGYEVHGLVRHASTESFGRIGHLRQRVKLHKGDLLDAGSLESVIETVQPTEFYNLAAMSFVPVSWDQPTLTSEITGLGVLRCLEAIRAVNPKIRFYQASSSEMYGKVVETPQSETTRFHPRSPYAVAKVFGHYMTMNFRESYGMYACSGILFNHESPRRGVEFVTRKITQAVARIKTGLQSELRLGNLDAQRDWGFAGDYVKAMWMMLQQEQPCDYVISTGKTTTIRDFLQMAFAHVNLDPNDYVVIDPRFYRPAEVNLLRGDATLARQQIGWEPETDLAGLVAMMVDHDMRLAAMERPSHDQLGQHHATAA